MSIYAMKKPKRVNSVSIALFIGLVLIGYLVYAFLPIYWPIFQLGGMMQTACNEAYRQLDNELVVEGLVKNAKRTGLPLTKDNFRMTRLPYSDEELMKFQGNTGVQETMRKRGKECLVEMRYRGSYTLPFTNFTFTKEWSGEKRAPLELIKWEKQCTCVTVPGGGGE
ncbi:MAG: hypothetical protein KC933_03335 [Myxococcales bacterium]|nr:hypothetical protein [Myxococcales bacterium]MCB9648004.1 hypothetical protein [Deltaproteobacteria bacterium]